MRSYIGYYGLTLISRSYVVLYASLGAHFCQFVFLALVENPHIDKVYNSIVKDSLIVRKRREVLYEGECFLICCCILIVII